MGVGIMRSCGLTPPNSGLVFPNPNPARFEIIRTQQVGKALVAEVKYPDCKNYEGRKILVYRSMDEGTFKCRTTIDPHFTPELGPIARFEPTDVGWKLAVDLALFFEQK